MSTPRHYVVIGSGVAGSQAAETLRQCDPSGRVSMVTLSNLPAYNRYDLPKVFRGDRDWRKFLIRPPEYYRDHKIELRRATRVSKVEPITKKILLGHNEEISYDMLLVASGGHAHVPPELEEFRSLLHGFGNFEQAMGVVAALPKGGHAVMLGGDMIGLDLARTLVATGYRVTLVAESHAFWPHELSGDERPQALNALRKMGIEVVDCAETGNVTSITEGRKGLPPRQIHFAGGSEIHADVVMPFFGLAPSVEFMVGSGVDIERGLLVSRALKTTDANVFAAGDVCQIWRDEDRRYHFYYGWKNVRAMGDLAARNMVGGEEPWVAPQDERLQISAAGEIQSPFWDYE